MTPLLRWLHLSPLWRRIRHHEAPRYPDQPPCPICGGPMLRDARPGDVLSWRRCVGCQRHQEGVV